MIPGALNRLRQQKSPYLLQHAANPVDWYPWGEDAFSRAKTEDKPVFLSVGGAVRRGRSCCFVLRGKRKPKSPRSRRSRGRCGRSAAGPPPTSAETFPANGR